tara:strand:- start:1127 stop:2128 length:1002 start_codon:yes stop_codon:yes gene_type:complete
MHKEKIYYDDDAKLENLNNLKVGIIGYGVQGRAQALNLRDSNINLAISNRTDRYLDLIQEDGFINQPIEELVSNTDIIMLLIPDQAHKNIFNNYILPNIKEGSMLVVAHGYSLYYKTIAPPETIDVTLLAPRMPGYPIRESYLKDGGIPAFMDIVQDFSKYAEEKVLGLAKALGFTRAGVLRVDYKIETELDLYIEQILSVSFLKAITESFHVLTRDYNYPPVATLLELYASGEMGQVLLKAAKDGITGTFKNNASPTCQYGMAINYKTSMETNLRERIDSVLNSIKSGLFATQLNEEGDNNYPQVNQLWKRIESDLLLDTQKFINENFKDYK